MTIPTDRLDAIEQSPHALIATTDEVRELVRAYRAAPDHSVDANKMVATDNGQGLRDAFSALAASWSAREREIAAEMVDDDDPREGHIMMGVLDSCARDLRKALATHPPQQERASSDRADALMDSAYLAGAKAGWNLGVVEDQLRNLKTTFDANRNRSKP